MRFTSIRTRTTLAVLLICSLIVAILGGMWLYTTYTSIKDDVYSSNYQDSRYLASYTTMYMKNITSAVEVVAHSDDTARSVINKDRIELKEIADNLDASVPESNTIHFTDETGEFIYSSRPSNRSSIASYAWYSSAVEEIISNNKTYLTDLYFSYSLNQTAFGIVTPVQYDSEIVGYVIVSIPPEELHESIKDQQVSGINDIIIVDSDGIVVTSVNEDIPPGYAGLSSSQPVQDVTRGKDGVETITDTWDGKSRITAYTPINETGWGVLISTPEDIAYKPLISQLALISITLVAFLVVLAIVSYYLSRYLTDPIVMLSDSMKSIAEGNRKVRVVRERPDEIGELSQSFNTMMSRLELAETGREKLLVQYKETNEELSDILDVTTSAISTIDLRELVDPLMARLVKIMKADAGLILLRDNDRLDLFACHGLEQCEKSGFSIPIGHGFSGRIASTGKPSFIKDLNVSDLEVYPPIKGLGVRSILGVPMKASGNIIGVIHIDWFNVHPVSERDLRILLVIAERISLAIVNARLYEQAKDLQMQTQFYLDLIGHDINNMNQIAMGHLEMAKEMIESGESLDSDDMSFIETPLETLKNSSRLIDNVRKLQQAKETAFKLEPINIIDVLADLKKEFINIPGRDITINLSSSAECPVEANHLIRDVFGNLMGNAVKHSDGSLTMNIHVDRMERDGTTYCRTTIEDDGPGIQDDKKEEIFERLKRGHTTARGSGLGLYLVKKLIENYQGRISVENRVPGDYTKGSKFVVLLPIKNKGY